VLKEANQFKIAELQTMRAILTPGAKMVHHEKYTRNLPIIFCGIDRTRGQSYCFGINKQAYSIKDIYEHY
jgi:hypothetical protein